MAYTTINKSTDYFNTKLYTGNGSTNAQTGVGFQPDWVWIKSRSQSVNHYGFDSVRGVTKGLSQNISNAESTRDSTWFNSFDSDGFTIGSEANINNNSDTYVAWNWKAGDSNTTVSASGSGNGAYNACTYRANTTAGFSIVKYTGRNSDISNGQNTRVTHGLGAKAHFIITKALTAKDWIVQGKNYNDANLHLNTTDAVSGSDFIGDNRLSTLGTTYFNVGNDNMVNENGVEFISYVFTSIPGYSKFGTYQGNSSASGTFIYTGFKPAFIMAKAQSRAESWHIFDNKREGYNVDNDQLYADANSTEATTDYIDILSNGFKFRYNSVGLNGSGETYVYMAFGQSLVGSNDVPCTAR